MFDRYHLLEVQNWSKDINIDVRSVWSKTKTECGVKYSHLLFNVSIGRKRQWSDRVIKAAMYV